MAGIGIGYAALSTTLSINGTSNIGVNASWDVHLENVQVTSGSVVATTPATISGDTVNFAVDLTTPGDFYEFTVDVVNEGTIVAKLGSQPTIPTLPKEVQEYVTYSITYGDGQQLNVNDVINTDDKKTIKVRLEFIKDISELPTGLEPLTLNFVMNFVQK